MAYDQETDARIAAHLSTTVQFERKKMFGGTGFLVNGNMVCGVYKQYLIVRMGEEAAIKSLEQPDTKIFDITGRPMKGWIMVEPDGYSSDQQLQKWIRLGLDFVNMLPPK